MTPSRSSRETVAAEMEHSGLMTESLPDIAEVPEGTARDTRWILAIRLLWVQRTLVGRIVLRGTVLFAVLAFLLPKSYDSTTQLMPPDSSSSGALALLSGIGGSDSDGASASGSGLAGMAASMLGMRTTGATFISVLKSQTVADRLIDRFDLRKVYYIKTYRDTRKKLAARTTIDEDKKSGVISITVTDRDPQRAAALARAYVEELDRLVAELNTSGAHRERVFLEGRLKVVKQELEQSEVDFSKFASENTAIDIKEQGKAMVEAAATLQGSLIAAQSELEGLEQIYTANNVRVRSLQARVEELKHQLDKLGGAASADSTSAGGASPLYPSIRQLPVLGVPYADLFLRVKINETIYEILTKQYELARVQEAKEVPSVKVLDVALPPERKAWPPRSLVILSGVFLSFCFAALWVFGREAWLNTDPQHPWKQLLEEIGTTVGRSVLWQRAREVSSRCVPRVFWSRMGAKSRPNTNSDREQSSG